MHLRPSQRANLRQLYDARDPETRLSRSAMCPHGIQIFQEISNSLGIKIIPVDIDSSWGSMSYLELTDGDLTVAQGEIDTVHKKLGQWVTQVCVGFDN
jgi:hypothetical protein